MKRRNKNGRRNGGRDLGRWISQNTIWGKVTNLLVGGSFRLELVGAVTTPNLIDPLTLNEFEVTGVRGKVLVFPSNVASAVIYAGFGIYKAQLNTSTVILQDQTVTGTYEDYARTNWIHRTIWNEFIPQSAALLTVPLMKTFHVSSNARHKVANNEAIVLRMENNAISGGQITMVPFLEVRVRRLV